jgi:hypothetical protein
MAIQKFVESKWQVQNLQQQLVHDKLEDAIGNGCKTVTESKLFDDRKM